MVLSNILLNINNNWNTIEKVRFIYYKMCKEIKYDERFLYSSNPELLKKIYYKNVSIDENIEPEIVCNTVNILFSQLLTKLNIKHQLIYKHPKIKRAIDVDDVACLFYDENDNVYFTNIAGDIENCKFGLKTLFFGTDFHEYDTSKPVSVIHSEELFEIDKKLGLIKHDYNDIVFELLKNEVKDTNHFKKFLSSKNIDIKELSGNQILEYKMNILNEYIKFRDMSAGSVEKKRFYQILFKFSILDKTERKNFQTFEYVKEGDENVDVILLICINVQTHPTYFYFSNETQSYVTIRKENLQSMLQGYHCSNKNKDIFNVNSYINTSHNLDTIQVEK